MRPGNSILTAAAAKVTSFLRAAVRRDGQRAGAENSACLFKTARHQLHIARKIGIIKPIYGQWNKAKIRGKAGNGVWF